MLDQIIIERSNRIPSILNSSETISQRQQKAVKHIIATIFSAQDALRHNACSIAQLQAPISFDSLVK